IGHADGLNAVAYSPDGTWLASAGMDTTVRLWRAADGSHLATAIGHSGPVRDIAICPDVPWFVTAGDDWIMLRRTSDGAALNTLARSEGARQAVAVSPDGAWLACVGRGGRTVRLLNINGTPRGTLSGHTRTVK